GQYRNAVASGSSACPKTHPTLPRYGTDLIQVSNNCLVNAFHWCRVGSLLESHTGNFAAFDRKRQSDPTEGYWSKGRVVDSHQRLGLACKPAHHQFAVLNSNRSFRTRIAFVLACVRLEYCGVNLYRRLCARLRQHLANRSILSFSRYSQGDRQRFWLEAAFIERDLNQFLIVLARS